MYNVILITLDGLRADRVSKCTYLDKLSREGLFFSNMITSAPYTTGSLHSIFSGLYPSKNGVNAYYSMLKFKKDRCKTLTQYLKEKAYYSVADLLNDSLQPTDGFDKFTIHGGNVPNLADKHKEIITSVSKHKPFFLFLHFSHIHDQAVKFIAKKYDDFAEEYFSDYDKNQHNYDSWLEFCNDYIKTVFEHIKVLGLIENTIVIIHADHGMSNGEKRGEKMYGSFLYDYTVKSWSIMFVPTIVPKRIDIQCRMIDIMPTVLEINGIAVDTSYESPQGKSLMPVVRGDETEDRVAFCETGGLGGPWPSPKIHNVFGLRYNKKKIVYNKQPNTWEFYDLESDPNEVHNLAGIGRTDFKRYKSMLLDLMIENDVELDV